MAGPFVCSVLPRSRTECARRWRSILVRRHISRTQPYQFDLPRGAQCTLYKLFGLCCPGDGPSDSSCTWTCAFPAGTDPVHKLYTRTSPLWKQNGPPRNLCTMSARASSGTCLLGTACTWLRACTSLAHTRSACGQRSPRCDSCSTFCSQWHPFDPRTGWRQRMTSS